jgi:hypothetical protein
MESCSICQKEFDPTLGVFFDNKWFCRECSIQYGQFEDCSRCRRKVARWGYTEHLGKVFCHECYDKVLIEERLARTCAICKKEVTGPLLIDPQGKKVCLECYRKHNLKPFGVRIAICRSCRKDVPESEVIYVKNKPVCRECVKEFMKQRTYLICSGCGSKIYEKPFKIDDKVVCAICYSKLSDKEERCAVCGKVIKAIKFIRRDGAVLCLDCSKKESQSAR